MGTIGTRNGQGIGFYQPELAATFLPGCASCSAPHPLARKPAIHSNACPDCGAPSAPGHTTKVAAQLTGFHPWAILARFCLWIGERLARLARSL